MVVFSLVKWILVKRNPNNKPTIIPAVNAIPNPEAPKRITRGQSNISVVIVAISNSPPTVFGSLAAYRKHC